MTCQRPNAMTTSATLVLAVLTHVLAAEPVAADPPVILSVETDTENIWPCITTRSG